MRTEEKIVWTVVALLTAWYLFLAGCLVAGIVLLFRVVG